MKILFTRSIFTILSALFIASQFHQKSEAATLNFDDINVYNSSDLVKVSNLYGGLSWSNFYIQNSFKAPNSGYDKGGISKPYVAFNGNGTEAIVKSNAIFDFNSAYLTAAWNDNLSLTIEGLFNGAKKYSQTLTLNTKSPIFLNFDYKNINELKFSSVGGINASLGGRGTHFVLDNFTYNITQVSSPRKSVPEEASLIAIFTVGVVGIATTRNIKKSF
jgi:hypothetical protein